jgi:hypothetical protein
VPPIFVVIFAPIFAWLWVDSGPRTVRTGEARARLAVHGPGVPGAGAGGCGGQADQGVRVSPMVARRGRIMLAEFGECA